MRPGAHPGAGPHLVPTPPRHHPCRSPVRVPPLEVPDAAEYRITVEPLGREVVCREDQTILDACLRAGVWMPHSCTHGTCATCKAEILDGEVDQGEASAFALMDFERDEGKTLPCVARPKSDVVLEADIDVDEDIPVHAGPGLHRDRRRCSRTSPWTPGGWWSNSTVTSSSTRAST